MVEAGFYLSPFGEKQDRVTCYACSIQIDDWDKVNDDPWTKHKEMSPNCGYLEKKQSYAHELTLSEFIDVEKYKFTEMHVSNCNVI